MNECFITMPQQPWPLPRSGRHRVPAVPTEPLTSSSLPPWRPLLRAAQEKEGRSPMRRWVQLATTGTDGWPRVRTLVYRGWRDANTVELLTDQRSRKVTELNQNPQCELCWLLPKARCQFRFKARRLTLQRDDQQRRALQHWVQRAREQEHSGAGHRLENLWRQTPTFRRRSAMGRRRRPPFNS